MCWGDPYKPWKSQDFIVLEGPIFDLDLFEFNNCPIDHGSFDQLKMSNHSLRARGTDLPFSHKSVVSIMQEQNVICSKTLICRQLFAGQVICSRLMKRKEKIHRMIILFNVNLCSCKKKKVGVGKIICARKYIPQEYFSRQKPLTVKEQMFNTIAWVITKYETAYAKTATSQTGTLPRARWCRCRSTRCRCRKFVKRKCPVVNSGLSVHIGRRAFTVTFPVEALVSPIQ